MPEDTWDSVTATPEPAALEAPAEPVVENPPAATLEKPEAPQLDAAFAPVRESESQEQIEPKEEPKQEVKDDYIAEADDPLEIAALPTPAAKRWAKRQFQDASPTRAFLDFDKPITVLGDDLYQRSPSRYTEHVNDLVTRHQDYVSKQLFGVSYEEAKSRLQPNAPVPTTTDKREALPTDLELGEMTVEQVTQRFQEIQAAQEQEKQRLQTEFQSKVDNLQKQFDAVNGKVATQEQQAQQAQIVENQNKLYNNVWSVVDEGIRNLGLEPQPNDPPKIASLKRAASRLLDKHSIEAAFDAVPENEKLVKYVFEATNRGEFQNAFREEDNLKVRARQAFESVKQSDEVKAILEEIQAYASQSKGTSRGANPIPPAPGSSTGVNIKPPASWDEAIAGAAS